MPHAVHEHVRVFGFQRPRAPLVDLPVDPFELVAQCLRGHAVSPQQLADVVDLAGAHARQVHVDQGFLDALLAPPVAFDHRGLEQGALEFRHLQLEPAGLGGELAFVVAGPVRLPSPLRSYLAAPVISSASASSIALRICVIFSVISRSSLVSSRFWSICMMFSGMVPSPGFQSRFFVLANENRTQDAGHALLRQGRNPKVRKNSGVIDRRGGFQAPVPGHIGFLRDPERGLHHEHRVLRLGTRARRQEHGRRVDRPHRAPRQARQIRGRLLPQRARPHDQMTKEKGAAGSDGAVSAGSQPPILLKNSAHTVDANLQKHTTSHCFASTPAKSALSAPHGAASMSSVRTLAPPWPEYVSSNRLRITTSNT